MSVQSVNRAVDILELFSDQKTRLGITEMGKMMGLSKTTVHGLVSTLAQRKLLCQDPATRKYMLGRGIIKLQAALASGLDLNAAGRPVLSTLAQQTGLNTHLAILDGSAVLMTLSMAPMAGSHEHTGSLGPRVPAHCTGLGKAVLAALDLQSRRAILYEGQLTRYTHHTITEHETLEYQLADFSVKGYAESRQEFMLGLGGMASAIRDSGGAVLGSVGISGPPLLIFGHGREELPRRLAAAARVLGAAMSGNRKRLHRTMVDTSQDLP